MFKSVSIENFKAIRKLDIKNLGQVNLLVGENNCGKTTILEALTLLIGGTNPESPMNLIRLRGLMAFHTELWRTFFHNMKLDEKIQIKEITQEKNAEYTLLIKPKRKEMSLNSFETSDIVSLGAKSTSIETCQTPIGLDLDYQNDKGEHLLSSVYEKDGKLQYDGQKPGYFNGVFLGPTSMYAWRDEFDEVQRKKKIPELVQLLKNVEPDIVDLRLNAVGMLEADIGLSRLLPLNLMGGGAAKILSVLTSILRFENGFVFIDEFENGLHHKNQGTLWDAVFTWAKKGDVQVFATTHSNECVSAFNSTASSFLSSDAKLFRIERAGEDSRAVEYSREELDEALSGNFEVR